jgi:hypothetical protein
MYASVAVIHMIPECNWLLGALLRGDSKLLKLERPFHSLLVQMLVLIGTGNSCISNK